MDAAELAAAAVEAHPLLLAEAAAEMGAQALRAVHRRRLRRSASPLGPVPLVLKVAARRLERRFCLCADLARACQAGDACFRE